MCKAVKAECERFRYGRHSIGCNLVPLVYLMCAFEKDKFLKQKFLMIIKYALCSLRFHRSDIVIVSWKDMYQLFCTKVC